jgi:DNA-binding HxlR family transcriptional regulator
MRARVESAPHDEGDEQRGNDVQDQAAQVLARVGNKWSIYIHVPGEAGTLRFSELKRRVKGISQRMHTEIDEARAALGQLA